MASSTQPSIKTKPVLEMQGITKTFHGFTALHDVNLTIYPGEVHALMGENGAGKSTLPKDCAAHHKSLPPCETSQVDLVICCRNE
jgi:ABC-type sugar transport system ATPase subunit